MTIALISTSPRAILQTYPGPTASVNVAGLWQQEYAAVGWTSPDGAYAVVAVTSFVPPASQEVTGSPSYGFDGNGNVIETYATQPIPPAPIVAVTSNSTPALDGTYAFDAETQAKMMAVALYIQTNGRFPDGLAPFPWPDSSGTMRMFATTAQFQALATAIADYATALNLGQQPTTPLTIA